MAAKPGDVEQEHDRLLTLRQAAEISGQTLSALRKRADRGTLRVVQRDSLRLVPYSELERRGLLVGARERELEAEVTSLQQELARHRQLVASVERDRDSTLADLERAQEAAAEADVRRRAVEEVLNARWWRRGRLRRAYHQTIVA